MKTKIKININIPLDKVFLTAMGSLHMCTSAEEWSTGLGPGHFGCCSVIRRAARTLVSEALGPDSALWSARQFIDSTSARERGLSKINDPAQKLFRRLFGKGMDPASSWWDPFDRTSRIIALQLAACIARDQRLNRRKSK